MNRTSTWIEQAYSSNDDSIIVLMGKSGADKTAFSRLVLPMLDPKIKTDPLRVEFENDSLNVDTNTLHIMVWTDVQAKDGQYLASAIEAAKEFTKRKIDLSVVKDTLSMKGTDWLFWLSDHKLPSNTNAKNIFMYAGGKSQSVTTHFSPTNTDEHIPAYQIYRDSIGNAGVTIWQTGSGEAMLTRLPNKNDIIFYSRLDPKWNGLVWSEQFPRMVIDLLYPVRQVRGRDDRLIDDKQFMPVQTKDDHSNSPLFSRPIDHWFWLMAFVLFLVERMLSYRKQKFANG
jgi:hypothetical protein